jgi:hypothetical protein
MMTVDQSGRYCQLNTVGLSSTHRRLSGVGTSTLNERHCGLDRLEGAWIGQEWMHVSERASKPVEAKARSTFHRSAGGFVLAHDYEQHREGIVKYSGHGVFWIDPETGLNCLTWWDSAGTGPDIFSGRWQNDDLLVLTRKSAAGVSRASWHFDQESYTHTLELSADGDSWNLLMEGTHHRAE